MDGSLGMELTQEQHKARLMEQLSRNPTLPFAPNGPMLERFDSRELAAALESALHQAAVEGHDKIRISLDFADAQALASFLRRAALLGA